MRFFVDGDEGHAINGWVVPDNPVAISRVHVSADGRSVAEIPATGVMPELREAGLHSTGQCRFQVNEENVPGLAELPRVEVRDVDTNVLIHRRIPDHGLCRQKAVLINTGIHPETVLQAALYPHFQHSYFRAGKFSEQVLSVIFDNPTLGSCLVSGALVYPRYEPHFVHQDILTMILVQEPFVEMASRMLWLRDRAALADDPVQNWRLGDLVEAARFTADYDYADPKSLKRFFRMLPEPAYRLLYNPLTRLLGTRFPEDPIMPANSIIAVEVLSRIGLVGHRAYFEAFAATVFDRLGIDAPVPAPAPIAPEAHALADRLRTLRDVQDFLNFDVVMSEAVQRSIAKIWAN